MILGHVLLDVPLVRYGIVHALVVLCFPPELVASLQTCSLLHYIPLIIGASVFVPLLHTNMWDCPRLGRLLDEEASRSPLRHACHLLEGAS